MDCLDDSADQLILASLIHKGLPSTGTLSHPLHSIV